MPRRDQCLLCGIDLEPIEGALGLQAHPESIACRVIYTDAFGVAVDEDLVQRNLEEPRGPDWSIDLKIYPLIEDVLDEAWASFELPKLGGMSSGKSWSSFSIYQQCPYKWKRRFIDHARPTILGLESPALAIGTLIHVFLALHYSQNLEDSPYRKVDLVELHDRLKRKANPEFVAEAWRVFDAYRRYWHGEEIVPLAIEHDLKDPRTGESCRFDMIAYHPSDNPPRVSGTFIYESKSAARFDRDTLEAWAGDGQILGQVALWKRLGLDRRFGELQGVVVNILGKQPVNPQFHRTIVSPTSLLIDQHMEDLKHWEGLIQLSRSNGVFPRARANCIGRYGRCQHWDHCNLFE